jgi:hypothetical protein
MDMSTIPPNHKTTRFVLVDHRKKGDGRIMDIFCDVSLSLQDDGRTLKIFLNDSSGDQR